MDSNEIVKMYNDEGLSLAVIGEKFERSKSSVSKTLLKDGYVRNKSTGKYEKIVLCETPNEQLNIETNNNLNNVNNKTNVSHETMNNKNDETNVSRETIEEMVNRTYSISSKVDKAMRIKSAVEGKKPIDIVREALKAYIEPKYFDM